MSTYIDWREAVRDCVVLDGWRLGVERWPQWTWAHLTREMVNGDNDLPFAKIYGALLERADRNDLPATTRAVLHYLARCCIGTGRPDRRCWPKLDVIADRVGASRTAVKEAIRRAEAAGWLKVVRHTRAPSDYILDVPERERCTCIDCRNPKQVASPPKGSESDCQGAESDCSGGGIQPSRGQNPTTHFVHSLDSSLHSEHSRRSPSGETPVVDSSEEQETRTGRRWQTRQREKEFTTDELLGARAYK